MNSANKIVGGKYQLIKKLGHGSYGSVFESVHLETKKKYAIKKIKDLSMYSEMKRVIREIIVLNSFNHENVLKLFDVHLEDNGESFNVYLVTDLMEFDLFKVIHRGHNYLTDEHIQYIMYQLFLGCYVLHKNSIIHRDLKPNNILLSESCDLKICDFGFAREISNDSSDQDPNTIYVVTRNYRAPEVMLNQSRYGSEVDIWSIGCTLYELLDCKILFGKAKNYIDLLSKILKLLGTPSEEAIDFIQNENAINWIKKQKVYPTQSPSTQLKSKNVNALAKDLLDKCLVFDPRKRITAREALMHPYFAELFDEEDLNVMNLEFDFTFENEDNLTLDRLKSKFKQIIKPMLN
jgi:mitogen-activated protein kinase 1/3